MSIEFREKMKLAWHLKPDESFGFQFGFTALEPLISIKTKKKKPGFNKWRIPESNRNNSGSTNVCYWPNVGNPLLSLMRSFANHQIRALSRNPLDNPVADGNAVTGADPGSSAVKGGCSGLVIMAKLKRYEDANDSTDKA